MSFGFIVVGVPILVLVTLVFLSLELAFSFLSERSYADFRETFSYGAREYWDDVRSILDNLGLFSFHV